MCGKALADPVVHAIPWRDVDLDEPGAVHRTDPPGLLARELAQRRESGFDVRAWEEPVRALLAGPRAGAADVERIRTGLGSARRRPDWAHHEPDGLPEIVATLPTAGPVGRASADRLDDRLLGAWLGRCAGCVLGKPVEIGDVWTAARIRRYLELAHAWPLTDYIPALDPMPAGFAFHETWPTTTRGRIRGAERDDDLDYSLLALVLLESHGTGYRTDHVARLWLSRLPYLATYTAERLAYRRLVLGEDPDAVGGDGNPFREWIGATIRADVHGYVHPGDPRAAALSVYADAALSHRGNGVYGAMWAAALVAAAFTAGSARSAVEESLQHVPPRSRLHEAVADVLAAHDAGLGWDAVHARILRRYGHYSWVHAVNNAALVAAGLLWGAGDFSSTIGLTVAGGWDTDSNGATAGSVAGILTGARGIPPHWTRPLGDTVRSALPGLDGTAVTALAARTRRLIGR